uniref:Polyketide synthase n=1 Tax=Peronospora matthiolae TaxID=2874970 RepID=A0AAV1ULE1_9STRA
MGQLHLVFVCWDAARAMVQTVGRVTPDGQRVMSGGEAIA